MSRALNDPYLALLVLFCAAVITVGAIITTLHRVPRAKFAQFQNELKEPVQLGRRTAGLIKATLLL
jgi:hypothetical protein